jgi:DNA-binding IclR family transcriptional regulator
MHSWRRIAGAPSVTCSLRLAWQYPQGYWPPLLAFGGTRPGPWSRQAEEICVAGAQSNPTRRVIALLNFLAQRPSRTFSLTELARELSISKSTLHALVETLTDAGYLMRDAETRQIRLGPALTGLGAAALGRRGHLIDSLRPAMEAIARELDAHCIVSADFDDWIVPLAAVGEPRRVTTLFHVGGLANPFTPPMGILFLPGRPMSEIQEWLGRADPPLNAAEAELSLSALDVLRVNGFTATARLDVKARLDKAFEDLQADEDPEKAALYKDFLKEFRRSRYLILDFTNSTPQEVDWIGIPLLDENGRVELAVVVLNLPDPLTGPEILDIARLMRGAVADVPGARLLPGGAGALGSLAASS